MQTIVFEAFKTSLQTTISYVASELQRPESLHSYAFKPFIAASCTTPFAILSSPRPVTPPNKVSPIGRQALIPPHGLSRKHAESPTLTSQPECYHPEINMSSATAASQGPTTPLSIEGIDRWITNAVSDIHGPPFASACSCGVGFEAFTNCNLREWVGLPTSPLATGH